MEVQNHGVVFEDNVIFAITGKTKTEYQQLSEGSYTSSMDIVNGSFCDTDMSVKVSKNGKGIACGDILRFLRHCRDNDFTMVVGSWKQHTPTTKRYSEIYEFYITPAMYKAILGNLTEDVLKPFVDYVKGIPEGKQAQLANRQLWKQKRSDLYNQCGGGIISIDAKIDSKTQRRVQCSLKLDEMISAGIEFHKYTTNYKGISLPYEQKSPSRTFS
jgi:hypothetical protein